MDIKNLNKTEMFALAMDAYRGETSKPEKYSASERKEGMNALLKDLAQDYRANKNEIFEIIETTISEVLPERLSQILGFADVKKFAEGDTPRFVVKNGKIKAYVTAVGSVVRRHRKDAKEITIETQAIQAKVYAELARVRAGMVDFAELIDDCLEALEDAYLETVYNAMTGAFTALPAANKHTAASFDAAELDKLVRVASSYGEPKIYGTRAALAALPMNSSSELDKEDIRNKGFIGKYKGTPCLELKNVTKDETNAAFVLSDQFVYVIPEGKDKIVKVAIEGDAYMRETDGVDWTKNFEVMTQSGTAVLQNNYFCIYKNTAL